MLLSRLVAYLSSQAATKQWYSSNDVQITNTLWGKKIAPFCFLNNFVKSRSALIILAHRYLNEFATKLTELSTSPNECQLHYLVNYNVCQTVHNHSNANIKRHDRLTVTDKHITTNVQRVCLWLLHAH